MNGELDAPTAAMCQVLDSPSCNGQVIDDCLQLHGGYGYMWEYPIARAYADARVQRIYRRHQRDHEGDHRAEPRIARPDRGNQ